MAVLSGDRPLRVLRADRASVPELLSALAAALDGSGPAVLPIDPSAPEPDGRDLAPLPSGVDWDIAVVVETSGSTGYPKRVALSAAALRAANAATERALGGPGEWLLALPANAIAGVQVLVRSLLSGTVPRVLDAGPFRPECFIEAVQTWGDASNLTSDAASGQASGQGSGQASGRPFGPASGNSYDPACGESIRPAVTRRYTSLVPVQLQRVLDHPDGATSLRSFDAVLIGGQRLPDGLAARAREAGVRVVRTYGSTETSGGCVYDGVPLDGVDVSVENGEVVIAGAVVAAGYLGDIELTRAHFSSSGPQRAYRTGDTGAIRDGVLSITGRRDRVIVSGGTNVALDRVEDVLRDSTGVHDLVVLGVSDETWGEVPVVVSDTALELATLRAVVRDVIGVAAQPQRALTVDAIPLTATGKPDRPALARVVRARSGDDVDGDARSDCDG